MTKFSIKAGILLEVLNLVKMKGKNHTGDTVTLIQSCILKVNKKNIKIETTDLQEAVFTETTISEFKCIEEGLIPVELEKSSSDKKNNTLIDNLSRFKPDDEIEVELQRGVIIVKRNKPRLTKKVNTITVDEVNYENGEGLPIKYNDKNDTWVTDGGKNYITKIVIDASEFKEVIKDGDQVAHRSYPVMINNKEVIVSVFDKNSGAGSERELIVEKDGLRCGNKPVGSLFSYGFGNVFGNLKGKLNIWFYQDQAMIISQDNKSYEYVILYSSLEVAETEEISETEEDEINIDEIELEDLEEITEEDLYVDYDENEPVVENWDNEVEEKEVPSMEWTTKQLIEYAVLNSIDIEYNDPKEKIFKDIMSALGEESEETVPRIKSDEFVMPKLKWSKKDLIDYANENKFDIKPKDTKEKIFDSIMEQIEQRNQYVGE